MKTKKIKKKNYYQKDDKNYQGKTYQKNYDENNKKNFHGKNFKYQNNKKFGFQNKSKNNKFDQANMMYNQNYNGMNKNMMNPYPNQGTNNMNNSGTQDFNFDPFFQAERTCEEILAYIFSIEFLNRELYLRKRITTEGLVDINHIMVFNKIKQRGFTLDQVREAVANLGSTICELVDIEGVLYIKITQWPNMELISIEQIQSQKRNMRNQKYQNMNFIAMQNNYFFPPNNQYGQQQMGQMPQGMMPMENFQQQPNQYMMHQMGGMNMPFPQQNFNPNPPQMNQQFVQQEEQNTQQNN